MAEGKTCPACGMSFPSQEALMAHGRSAHPAKQHEHEHFRCKACGAEFETQDELMKHGKSSHSM